jgi:serine/threonine protein kinase
VYEGKEISSSNRVALKEVLPKAEKEGFPITALREMKILSSLSHPNIVHLERIVFGGSRSEEELSGSVYMVFPYIKHDLVGLQHFRQSRLSLAEIKCITIQLLQGLAYLHGRHVVHRDLKLANILIDESGNVKIADFGLARKLPSIESTHQTNRVITRWYRPPELLLGSTLYDSSVDCWSLGCIFAELVCGYPLFPGETEVHVLRYIMDTLGPPNERIWPGFKKLSDSSDVLKLARLARRNLTEHIKNPKGYCNYSSRDERPVGLLIKDRDSHYLHRAVFRKQFKSISKAGMEFVGSLLRYDPKERSTAAKASVHLFLSVEEPRACSPDQIILPFHPMRELEVKELVVSSTSVRRPRLKRVLSDNYSVDTSKSLTPKRRRKQ